VSGQNWRCDPPIGVPGPGAGAGWRARRTAALAVLAGLAGFYAWTLATALTPPADEAFQRTYLTREFGAYPTSPAFGGANGLAYRLGDRVVFDDERPRLLLTPGDWGGEDADGAILTGMRGRLFLHLEDRAAARRRPLTLTLEFTCAMPKGERTRLAVSVDGQSVGATDCGRRPVVVHLPVAAGIIGQRAYAQITVTRAPDGLRERLATRFGLRYGAVRLEAMTIAPADAPPALGSTTGRAGPR
jgi:hypothetical protein